MARFRVDLITDELAFVSDDPTSTTGEPLSHYLELDIEYKRVRFGERYSTDNAVPMRVWHGLVRRYELPTFTDAVALTQAINNGEFDSLLGRIVENTEIVWDGHNWVCEFHPDAEEAEQELQEKLRDYELDMGDCGGVWSARDWLRHVDIAQEYGVTADSTEEELERIAEKIEKEARVDKVVLYGLRDTLRQVRDGLKEETE